MEAWENFIKLQEIELGFETVAKWLRTLKMLHFDACNIYLEAKDSFQALWFEEHIRPKIIKNLVNNNKKRIKVHLSSVQPDPKATANKDKNKDNPPPAPKFNLTFQAIDPSCRFDTFITSPPNELLFKLLSHLQENLTNPKAALINLPTFNPIYIYGSSGTGKTHLLMAAAHELSQKGLKVIYSRAESFTEHVIGAIRAGEMGKFRQAYRNIDVLIMDDVDFFGRKAATQEEFFHTFNTLHLEGKQMILAAKSSPQALQFIEPRLISRFEWGIVLQAESLNDEELIKMLQKKCEMMNFKLSSKILAFLLELFPTGTKSLVRALQALILRTHSIDNKGTLTSLTIPQVNVLLKDLILEEEQMMITPSRIIGHVAEHFGIKSEDILGKSQSRGCVLPRQISMYFCRTELKTPFVKIGDIFSKDHSTVMSSVNLIENAIKNNNPDIANTVTTIRRKIKC